MFISLIKILKFNVITLNVIKFNLNVLINKYKHPRVSIFFLQIPIILIIQICLFENMQTRIIERI